MIKRIFLVLCIVGSTSFLCSSQELFDRGESGVEARIFSVFLEKFSLRGGSASYTLNGRYTIGTGYSKLYLKNADVTADSWRHFASVMPIKQGDFGIPLSLKLEALYQKDTYSVPIIGTKIYGYGLGLFHKIGLGNIKLIPGVGYHFYDYRGTLGTNNLQINQNVYTGQLYIVYKFLFFNAKYEQVKSTEDTVHSWTPSLGAKLAF